MSFPACNHVQTPCQAAARRPSTGALLAKGETGLVLVRGHSTLAHFRNEAENARTPRAEGGFDTGDLESLDAESRLVFHARL